MNRNTKSEIGSTCFSFTLYRFTLYRLTFYRLALYRRTRIFWLYTNTIVIFCKFYQTIYDFDIMLYVRSIGAIDNSWIVYEYCLAILRILLIQHDIKIIRISYERCSMYIYIYIHIYNPPHLTPPHPTPPHPTPTPHHITPHHIL